MQEHRHAPHAGAPQPSDARAFPASGRPAGSQHRQRWPGGASWRPGDSRGAGPAADWDGDGFDGDGFDGDGFDGDGFDGDGFDGGADDEQAGQHAAAWLLDELPPAPVQRAAVPPETGNGRARGAREQARRPDGGGASARRYGAETGARYTKATRVNSAPIRRAGGAPAASMPGLAGRFAAEWWPAGTTSRRNSLQREGGRTGGGVMVRRAVLDHGEELAADDEEALPASQPPGELARPAGQQWRGAGGRWLVWAGRAVVWAVLILIGYRGVLAIVTGQEVTHAAAGRPAHSGASFPIALAEAYALQFGGVYLNYSPASANTRSQELARFLPPGSGSQLGWNGSGTQHLLAEQVAGIAVKGSHFAIVTLLATIDSGRMIELGVPVYVAHGGIGLSGEPALLPAPAAAVPPRGGGTAAADQATQAALQSQLPGFFQAYAASNKTTLARFAAAGSHITGLGGAVSFAAIDSLYAPTGGNTRQIVVTVTWQVPSLRSAAGAVASAPASLQMTYQLTVVKQGGSWDVQAIGAAAQSREPPG
jgi:hypothetical protein